MNHNNPGRRRHMPQHQNKRGGGGSGGGNRGGQRTAQSGGGSQISLNKIYDSAGPDVKIKGTAAHIYEKYISLARDANSSGDRVLAENYTQHAEHYLRIINEIQEQLQSMYRPAFDANEATAFTSDDNEQPSEPETSSDFDEPAAHTQRENARDRRDSEDSRFETDREQRPKRALNIPFLKRTHRSDDERGERNSRPHNNQPREREAQPTSRERQPEAYRPQAENASAPPKTEDANAGGRRANPVRRRVISKPTEGNSGEGSASE